MAQFNRLVTRVHVLHLRYAIALVPIVTVVPIVSFALSKAYAFADPAAQRRKA